MKKILLYTLALVLAVSAAAQDTPLQLVIRNTDGTRVSYNLNEQPVLSFTATDLVVTTADIEVSYSLRQVANFTYETVDNAAVSDITASGQPSFSAVGDLLTVSAPQPGATVDVFTVNGQRVFGTTLSDSDTPFVIPVDNLSPGVYIISINGVTHKYMKR